MSKRSMHPYLNYYDRLALLSYSGFRRTMSRPTCVIDQRDYNLPRHLNPGGID